MLAKFLTNSTLTWVEKHVLFIPHAEMQCKSKQMHKSKEVVRANTLKVTLLRTFRPVPYLGHDLWVWVLNGISPLHCDQISPNFDLATH